MFLSFNLVYFDRSQTLDSLQLFLNRMDSSDLAAVLLMKHCGTKNSGACYKKKLVLCLATLNPIVVLYSINAALKHAFP